MGNFVKFCQVKDSRKLGFQTDRALKIPKKKKKKKRKHTRKQKQTNKVNLCVTNMWLNGCSVSALHFLIVKAGRYIILDW